MSNRRKILLALAFLSCGHESNVAQTRVSSASANDNPLFGINLIDSCTENGGYKSHCKFENSTVAKKQEYETKFSVKTTFNCHLHAVDVGLDFGLLDPDQAVSKHIAFNSGTITTVVPAAWGPVVAKSFNADALEHSFLSDDCNFHVDEVSTEPSDGSKSQWRAEKLSLIQAIDDDEKSRDAFASLKLLLPAYQLLNRIMVSLAEDVSKDIELRKAISATINSTPNGPDSDTAFDKILYSSDPTITEPMKRAVSHIVTIFNALPSISECESVTSTACTGTVVLQNKLSDADKTALGQLQSRMPDEAETNSHYSYFAGKKVSDQAQLDELIGKYGQWIQ